MLPFILGGVALAVTGFGIKKYLDDEDFRFASGIYYKQLHFDDYFRKLKE